MVVEAAISGGDRPRSDEGEWCSGRFRIERGSGAPAVSGSKGGGAPGGGARAREAVVAASARGGR
jgi:hypothetical protein